jgi:hypothetical protein
MGVAFILDRISVRAGVEDDAFERCMLGEIFPAIDTSAGAGQTIEAHEQFLLRGEDPGEYLWVSRIVYAIHATPTPQWLLNRVARIREQTPARLAEVGKLTAGGVNYDVAHWLPGRFAD